ncbi:aminopeptidase O-like isoform X2 [Oscarella lobularis]|uniref:aminopeptidase O-like isoform X2 n=1 Tax=Oscarella lobularis TaxID=121494 RepID=UPI0033143A68
MQPIYHSTVFACETSDDGRRVRCDFRHCNLHFRGEKDYVWLLNTTQNVKLLEKHVGEEIEKFMTDQKIEFPSAKPKTIGEWNRDETKIRKIESTTRKLLVIFELDEPHASVGKWLEKFVTAACLELHLIDICVVTKTFRSRRELLRVIRQTGIELNSHTIPLEVIVLLSCHSSSQGQVFSCTPSSITQKCQFEEFCSLHDFICTCQDSLGRLLKGIHVSSCFALKLDASHKFWPVDAQWIRRHLTCVVSGSVKEVYETGSQAADVHLALASLLGTSSSTSSLSNIRNLKDVVEEARQRSFPDLAEEMGLRIMKPDKLEEELEQESINDEVHPRPLVSSDVCVAFLADKSDLSSCFLGDALATSLQLRPDVKSDIIVISVDLGEDSTSRAASEPKKPRRDIEAILENCLAAVWTQEKPVFLVVLGCRLSHLKSHVVKATRPDKIFGIHFANLPTEAETSSLDFNDLNTFVTGTTDGKFVKHPGHAALYPLLLYMIQLATGENGSRLAPLSLTGKSAWNAPEVFKEVCHVMEGLSRDCQLRILRSKSKEIETKNPEEKFRASQSDTSSDILDIERLDDEPKPPTSKSPSRTNDLPLSANVREVLVRHFILDLSIDFSTHVIGGTIVLFVEGEERLSSVHLCLDACDLVIERVEEIDPLLTPQQSSLSFEDQSECFGYEKCCEIIKLNGSPLRYETTDWKMNIFAPENRTKFPRCVKIVYHTKPTGKSLAWANDVNGRPCVFNWGAPINNRAMFPGQDVPGGLSTWNAIARVPKGCLVLMSGNFYENRSLLKDDFECHFYAMGCLLPCCCVGFAAGYFVASSAVASLCESDSWSSTIPCRLFAAESQLPAVAKEFHVNLPKYLSAACTVLGPFPYVRLDVIILPRSFGCMGLASPNLVFLSPSVVSGDGSMSVRIGHEMSHAWFGCSIGPKDWTEEWLTEGFATYCEDVIEAIALEWPLDSWENRFGLKAVIKWKTLVGEIENTAQTKELLKKEESRLEKVQTSRGHMFAAAAGSSVKNALNPDKRFLQIHYVKGYFLLRYMASKIGVLEFNKVLKAYTTKFRSSLVKSQDFFDVFFDLYPSSKCSEFSSETLTRDWLQSPTVPIRYSDVTSNNSLFNASLEQIEYWRKVDRKNQRKSSPKKPWETTTLPLSDQLIVALEGLLELKKLHRSTLTQLNRCYKFASQNADIRHRWCELIIKHLHRRAFGDVRRFLTEDQGMGVYLYGELMCSEDEKAIALAREIFDDIKDEMDYETRLIVSEMVYG